MRDSVSTRRDLLRLIAGSAGLMVGAHPVLADERRIGKLITQARKYPIISQRIGFISGALRGTHYRADTLIGGPHRPEKFVVRDDAFDCVTFCETVLAAAMVRAPGEFDTVLRDIRYHNGVVEWRERNHYFFQWCQHNVDNGLCRWVTMDGAVELHKRVDTQVGLSPRRFDMHVIPQTILLANKPLLQTGDVIGFVSRRPNLDYFHAGLVAFAPDGALLLRHAAESRGRVLDQRLDHFLARWRVRYVTLLRPQDTAGALLTRAKQGG